jgi:hypothetical protein
VLNLNTPLLWARSVFLSFISPFFCAMDHLASQAEEIWKGVLTRDQMAALGINTPDSPQHKRHKAGLCQRRHQVLLQTLFYNWLPDWP